MNYFDIGIEEARKDLKEQGLEVVRNTVNNYMEDPIVVYYDENTKQLICGYCSFYKDYMKIKQAL